MKEHPVSFEDLVAFASGDLSGREAATVEAYLAVLPKTLVTVARLREVIEAMRADDAVAPTAEAIRRALAVFETPPRPCWLDRLDVVIARLVFDTGGRLALAGYRGAAGTRQMSYDSAHGRIDLQVLPGRGESGRIIGQVTPRDGAATGVALGRAGGSEPATRTSPDDHGLFRVEVEAGVYDLVVELDGDRAIVAPGLAAP